MEKDKDIVSKESVNNILSNVSVDIIIDTKEYTLKRGNFLNEIHNKFTDTVISESETSIILNKINYVFCNFVCSDLVKIAKSLDMKLHFSFNAYFNIKPLSLLNVDKFIEEYDEKPVVNICNKTISLTKTILTPKSVFDISDEYKQNFFSSTEGLYLDFSKVLYLHIDLPVKKDVTISNELSVINYILYTVCDCLTEEHYEDSKYKELRERYSKMFKSPFSYIEHIKLHKNVRFTIDMLDVNADNEIYKKCFLENKDILIEIEQIIQNTDEKEEIGINIDTEENLIEIKMDSLKDTAILNKGHRFIAFVVDELTNCIINNAYISNSKIKSCKLVNCKLINKCEYYDTGDEKYLNELINCSIE